MNKKKSKTRIARIRHKPQKEQLNCRIKSIKSKRELKNQKELF